MDGRAKRRHQLMCKPVYLHRALFATTGNVQLSHVCQCEGVDNDERTREREGVINRVDSYTEGQSF